jgi:peptidyl-prolyl cis-trans isomerase C
MSRRRAAASGLLLLASTWACGTPAEQARPTSSTLPSGIVARVQGELVSGPTVARIAESQGLALQEALSRAVTDALFAASGRERLAPGVASSLERAAAARALLERFGADAVAAGPAKDAEIAALTKERWAELDRPDGARTTHVVVINRDSARDAAAKSVAEALRAALAAASSSEEFVRLAKTVPSQGFDVKAEPLPAITADGRAFERQDQAFLEVPMTFDLDFARAALQLQQAGELSGVVKTRFGFHVLRLEERIAASAQPKAELRLMLGPEVQTRRASQARLALLEKLRGANAVQIERAVDELTARVQTAP